MDSPADTCRLINSFSLSLQRSAGQKALYCSIAARAIKISNALSISHLRLRPQKRYLCCKCKLNNGRIWHVSFPSLSWRVCPVSTFNWLLMYARPYVIESFASKVLTWCVNAYKRFNCLIWNAFLEPCNFERDIKGLIFLMRKIEKNSLSIITFQFINTWMYKNGVFANIFFIVNIKLRIWNFGFKILAFLNLFLCVEFFCSLLYTCDKKYKL